MPELPEVETIKKGLEKKVVGLVIKKVEVLNPKSFQGDSKDIEGRKITGVFRRAKILGLELEGDITLLFHLKMSGQVILGGERQRSTRIIFNLSSNSQVLFNDQRKFGWVKVVSDREKQLEHLGPEPLEKDFTSEVFKKQISKRKKTPIKVALLDQRVVAGVGNIYVCEALFLAGVLPTKKVNELTESELKKIHQGVVKSLQTGVDLGGSSKHHYVDIEGKKGSFLAVANVYGREKEVCKICGKLIKKMKLAGRGTYFCEVCQR